MFPSHDQKHQELKTETAGAVCMAAHDFSNAAYGTKKGQSQDRSLILTAWRGHWKTFISELHAANNPFVELGEPNKNGEQKPVMTGYGRNVASIARGVIEYDINPFDDQGEAKTYLNIQEDVQAARRAAAPDDKKRLREAKESLTESIKAFRSSLGNSEGAILLGVALVQFINEQISEYGPEAALNAIDAALEETDMASYVDQVTDHDEDAEEDTEESPAGTDETTEDDESDEGLAAVATG